VSKRELNPGDRDGSTPTAIEENLAVELADKLADRSSQFFSAPDHVNPETLEAFGYLGEDADMVCDITLDLIAEDRNFDDPDSDLLIEILADMLQNFYVHELVRGARAERRAADRHLDLIERAVGQVQWKTIAAKVFAARRLRLH
jgi:hypothetical protein